MHMCVCKCIHTCIHAYIHACIHSFIHSCIHTHLPTCLKQCVYVEGLDFLEPLPPPLVPYMVLRQAEMTTYLPGSFRGPWVFLLPGPRNPAESQVLGLQNRSNSSRGSWHIHTTATLAESSVFQISWTATHSRSCQWCCEARLT